VDSPNPVSPRGGLETERLGVSEIREAFERGLPTRLPTKVFVLIGLLCLSVPERCKSKLSFTEQGDLRGEENSSCILVKYEKTSYFRNRGVLVMQNGTFRNTEAS